MTAEIESCISYLSALLCNFVVRDGDFRSSSQMRTGCLDSASACCSQLVENIIVFATSRKDAKSYHSFGGRLSATKKHGGKHDIFASCYGSGSQPNPSSARDQFAQPETYRPGMLSLPVTALLQYIVSKFSSIAGFLWLLCEQFALLEVNRDIRIGR